MRKKLSFLFCTGVVIVFFSLYYMYRFPFNTTNAAYPVKDKGRKALTMGTLKELWENKQLYWLPDLSDYVVHCAYQEGLLYGSTYAFPAYPGDLVISSYEKEPVTGKIMKNKQTIRKYNRVWWKDVIWHISPHSLEHMLFQQGKAVPVSIHPVGFNLQYPKPGHHIILIFFLSLISIFSSDFYLTSSRLYDMKKFTSRRWLKAA